MSQMEEVMKALLKSSNHCGGGDGSVGQRGSGRLQAVNGLVDITIRCCALLFSFTFTRCGCGNDQGPIYDLAAT